MSGNRDYVADRRQYGATGKRTGGGWAVLWWDGVRKIWEEGAIYETKALAIEAMREKHSRQAATTIAARALRAIPSETRAAASRENGKRPVKPGSKPRGRPKGKKERKS